jgi:hypothetical protein
MSRKSPKKNVWMSHSIPLGYWDSCPLNNIVDSISGYLKAQYNYSDNEINTSVVASDLDDGIIVSVERIETDEEYNKRILVERQQKKNKKDAKKELQSAEYERNLAEYKRLGKLLGVENG